MNGPPDPVLTYLTALALAWFLGFVFAILGAATHRGIAPVVKFLWIGGILLLGVICVPAYLIFVERRGILKLLGIAIVLLSLAGPVLLVEGIAHLPQGWSVDPDRALPGGTRQI